MKLLNYVVLILGVFCIHGVSAEKNIQYNYGEFRFVVDSDLDDTSLDGDGFAFSGSLRLDELFYAIVDYEAIEYDRNAEITDLQVGAGLIAPVRNVDGIAELAIIHRDVDHLPIGDSDTGFRFSGGLRGYLTPQFELRGTVNLIEVDDFDDTFITIAGDYFLNDSVSINIAKDLSADIERFSIGVRLYLGE